MSVRNQNSTHTWRFSRIGGFDQVRLESAADLRALAELDQKLWVALACPTRGIEFDARTLDAIDTDHDGRIRVPEVLAATAWACDCLKDPGVLFSKSDSLSLAAINDATEEGRRLLASARQILSDLGKPEADVISVADTTDTARIFAATRFNGDGVITPDSTDDAGVRKLIEEIAACAGSETDRSGKPGITEAGMDRFYEDARAFADWCQTGENNDSIRPLGDATATAAATVKAVRTKVEDYFARCRLAAFDSRAAAPLNRDEKEYAALATRDLTASDADIAALPLARVEPDKALPLAAGVNPAWAAAMAHLQSAAVKPLLGDRTSLSETDWATLVSRLAPFEAWQGARKGAAVEPLGIERVREILTVDQRAALQDLMAKDRALEPQAQAIAAVDKLVRLHRDLGRLRHNFVAFRDFYGRQIPAAFQAGTLYLDQRSCELCLPVEDAAKHAAMAGLAGTFLAYCDCIRKATGEKMQIVAAFTDGDSDNLMVGRNGVFYDRKGRDWDATITKIVDNPISLRQAFWGPYKKLVRMIEEQVAKRAAAADSASNAKLSAAAETAANVDKAKPAAPATTAPAPGPKKLDVGIIAAMGVAFGAISTFLATAFSKVVELKLWQIGLVLVGIILVISGPSMLIAWLKLRKRNLGPILDANGWAINARARLN
ncbi:MAG: hypothetical protein KDM81_11705, partial [Verrucomicrobiae bacterium]|nr:hypothetical protein [Verrucomicrobiae bacterium]